MYAVPESVGASFRQEMDERNQAAVAANSASVLDAAIEAIQKEPACILPDTSDPSSTNTVSHPPPLASSSMDGNVTQLGVASNSQASAPTKLAKAASTKQAQSRASFGDWLAPPPPASRSAEQSIPARDTSGVSTAHAYPIPQPSAQVPASIPVGNSVATPCSNVSSVGASASIPTMSHRALQPSDAVTLGQDSQHPPAKPHNLLAQRPNTTATSAQGQAAGGATLSESALSPIAESERSLNPCISASITAPAKRKSGTDGIPEASKQLRTAVSSASRTSTTPAVLTPAIARPEQLSPASAFAGTAAPTARPVSRVLQDSTNKPVVPSSHSVEEGAPYKPLATEHLTTVSHKPACQPSGALQLDASSTAMHKAALKPGV